MHQQQGFTGTIASYQERGKGGNATYRGNCSPRFVADYLLTFNPDKGLTIDPMEGGGTTKDVCADLNVPYQGFDLRHGFDSRRDSIRASLDRPAAAAFVHPPYAGMIRYSRDVWNRGKEVDADLSARGTDIEQFCEDLQAVLYNVFDALAVGATYIVLLGLWRHPQTKELIHLPARIFPYCPGSFVNEVVKAQHNTMSGSRSYGAQPFVLTTHEVAFVFRKTGNSLVGSVVNTMLVGQSLEQSTWRNVVRALVRKGKRVTTVDVLNAISAHPKAGGNNNLRAKCRQVLATLTRSGVLVRERPGQYIGVA